MAKSLFGISASIVSLNSSTRKYIKCTFDALLLDLFSTFCSANCLTHAQAFGDMALRSMEAESEWEKRRRGNLNWSLVNLERFFFSPPLPFSLSPGMLTWPDQKHPTGTDPCSHKGKPLMPLPWLPWWTHEPPVDAWLKPVTKSLYTEKQRLTYS